MVVVVLVVVVLKGFDVDLVAFNADCDERDVLLVALVDVDDLSSSAMCTIMQRKHSSTPHTVSLLVGLSSGLFSGIINSLICCLCFRIKISFALVETQLCFFLRILRKIWYTT